MREIKGIIFALVSLLVLMVLNTEFANASIPLILIGPFRWAAFVFFVISCLDAMQVIKVFRFNENKKLINSIERKPRKSSQPWEE